MQFTDITPQDRLALLNTARDSINYGLLHNTVLPVELGDYSPLLQSKGASFVTLNIRQQLRGCIGTLEAYQPLITDVSQHAFDAAFQDPRFAPVSKIEIEQLEIHISILTPAEPIEFSSEQDLLRQLEPGKDGLIIEDSSHRATFLPSVWEQLPEPVDFLDHLKAKAGLGKSDWHSEMRASRYHAISVE